MSCSELGLPWIPSVASAARRKAIQRFWYVTHPPRTRQRIVTTTASVRIPNRNRRFMRMPMPLV
jgi:hypothetical protein